ncbi:MAG: vWA domain-containing protein [Phycisphaerales bacterium]
MFTVLAPLALASLLACPPTDPSGTPQERSGEVLLGAVADGAAPAPAAKRGGRPIDLCICLDTSGSMNGLIDAARSRLWDIVNDLALAKPTPRLRVALLSYGNTGHPAEKGWVKVETDFTDDLDLVSKALFALTTNGGEEYVGRVLDTAAKELTWTPSATGGATNEQPLQIVMVAGNESADQDRTVSFRDACRALIARGIVVNPIYCGPPDDDVAPGWREVATLSDGHFAAIDQSVGALAISTPFDDDLARLSAAINTTYLPYGDHGAWAAENQTLQDSNAAMLNSATAAQRCVSKGGELYSNERWDLVDACKQADFKLESVKAEDLPESMRIMTPEQCKAHVAAMGAKRDELKRQIADLGQKRQAFADAESSKSAEAGRKTFGAAMREALRAQAAARGFGW